jgi:sugar/nucleoside kinase (ribokinase family)
MVENVANTARQNDIVIFTIGFNGSDRLDDYEVSYGSTCGYGTEEYGRNILQRLANTPVADSYDSDQPSGLCIIFTDPSEAEAAFAQVASAILRLTR